MRLAMFGAGGMGATHARAYRSFGNRESVELAGVWSRSAAKARGLANQLKVPWSTDADALLRDETIDAIDVTVPSAHHRKLVVSALAHGKHVFCETPIALTVQDADAMIEAAHANRRILMVAQIMRFVEDYREAHDEATSGKLGRPRAVVARRLGRPYWSAKRPRPFRVYGEPIIEFSIHDFDVANWILGRPLSVLAYGVSGSSGVTEHAHVSVRYRAGDAFIEGSTMMPPGFPFTTSVEVHCDSGVFEHVTQFTGGPIPKIRSLRYTERGIETARVREHDPYREECRHFVRSVLRKADPKRLRPEADRDALQVSVSALESIRKRSEVDIRR